MPYSATLNGSGDLSYDSCDDLDESVDINQDLDDCVWSENDKTSSGEWLNDIDKVSCDNEKKEFGPLYANLSLKENSCPPIPKSGTDPNRVLLNHWSEYIHLTGRKFYYNSVTKQSSWKPPRRSLPIVRLFLFYILLFQFKKKQNKKHSIFGKADLCFAFSQTNQYIELKRINKTQFNFMMTHKVTQKMAVELNTIEFEKFKYE